MNTVTDPCHTPAVERGTCLESSTHARRIAHVHGAPPSSSSPAARAVLACIADHACRQSAYEHRHGFEHQRTVRPLPGQVVGDVVVGLRLRARRLDRTVRTDPCPAHQRQARRPAARNPVRALGATHHRPTLHRHASSSLSHLHRRSADSNPLRYGISASNELARLRSLLDDIGEQRVSPTSALSWIRANSPIGGPDARLGQHREDGATTCGTNT